MRAVSTSGTESTRSTRSVHPYATGAPKGRVQAPYSGPGRGRRAETGGEAAQAQGVEGGAEHQGKRRSRLTLRLARVSHLAGVPRRGHEAEPAGGPVRAAAQPGGSLERGVHGGLYHDDAVAVSGRGAAGEVQCADQYRTHEGRAGDSAGEQLRDTGHILDTIMTRRLEATCRRTR